MHIELIEAYCQMLERLEKENLPKYEKQFDGYLQKTLTDKVGEFRMFFSNWKHAIKSNIDMLNDSLKGIDYRMRPVTYIQQRCASSTGYWMKRCRMCRKSMPRWMEGAFISMNT